MLVFIYLLVLSRYICIYCRLQSALSGLAGKDIGDTLSSKKTQKRQRKSNKESLLPQSPSDRDEAVVESEKRRQSDDSDFSGAETSRPKSKKRKLLSRVVHK